MRSTSAPLAATVTTLLVLLLLGTYFLTPAMAAIGPTEGFVSYQVTLSKDGYALSTYVLNETATPQGRNGLVELTFALSDGDNNLPYSRVVNSTRLPEIFPFLPNLQNRTFSYSSHGFNAVFTLVQDGTSTVRFHGASYSVYVSRISFTVSVPRSMIFASASGRILTMPSGLVYSFDLSSREAYAVQGVLLATNLPLTDSVSTNATLFGLGLVGVSILGAIGFALPSAFALGLVRLRGRSSASPPSPSLTNAPAVAAATPTTLLDNGQVDEKPAHWVD